MSAKPFDLPIKVVKQFVKDMRAFHAEPNAIKRDRVEAPFQPGRYFSSPKLNNAPARLRRRGAGAF